MAPSNRPTRTVGRAVPREAPISARDRFLTADAYRAAREWARYEATAQRDLFRELRERFLARHCPPVRWALDAGAGPLRFTRAVGSAVAGHVALDLSIAMLRHRPDRSRASGPGAVDRIRGDAVRPPFAPRSFGALALLGNTLGFAGPEGPRLIDASLELLEPGGTLLVEIAPGPGEHSRYLARLPGSAVRRLLWSPPSLVLGRVRREGFVRDPSRRTERGEFTRYDPTDLARSLRGRGLSIVETIAVAPGMGSQPERVEMVRSDPKAWDRLLHLEESLGREPDRWPDAAAVLLAAVVPPAA